LCRSRCPCSQNALKYSQADFANLQRRSAEEFSQASEKAIKRFASDLLSTIDILSLALKHVPQPIPADNVPLKALFDGVEMTQTELLKTLKRHGVEPINPMGEKFDPHFHEALFQVPVPGKEPGTVMDVSQVGYTLKGKSLRAAQVGVVRPPVSSAGLSPPSLILQFLLPCLPVSPGPRVNAVCYCTTRPPLPHLMYHRLPISPRRRPAIASSGALTAPLCNTTPRKKALSLGELLSK
jgi:molecular chaperone GrpE (heat shock protein)